MSARFRVNARRSVLLAAVSTAVLVGGVVSTTAASAASAPTPESFTSCHGQVANDRSGAAIDEPYLLDYRFSCDTNISAYTLIVDRAASSGGNLDDFNANPNVFAADGVTPSSTTSVTCEGTTPSNGFNCNFGAGGSLAAGDVIAGSVDLVAPYCKSLPPGPKPGTLAKSGTLAIPRAQVSLVVTDSTGAEDGPFALGRTTACPKVPNVVPKPKVKSKAKSKRTAKGRRATRAAA